MRRLAIPSRQLGPQPVGRVGLHVGEVQNPPNVDQPAPRHRRLRAPDRDNLRANVLTRDRGDGLVAEADGRHRALPLPPRAASGFPALADDPDVLPGHGRERRPHGSRSGSGHGSARSGRRSRDSPRAGIYAPMHGHDVLERRQPRFVERHDGVGAQPERRLLAADADTLHPGSRNNPGPRNVHAQLQPIRPAPSRRSRSPAVSRSRKTPRSVALVASPLPSRLPCQLPLKQGATMFRDAQPYAGNPHGSCIAAT